MSNGAEQNPWSYPVVESEIVDRAQGRCLKIVVAVFYEGEELRRDRPIMKLVDRLSDDPERRREEIEKELAIRRRHLRRRHERGGPKEDAANETAQEIEELHGPGTARARGENSDRGGGS